MACWSREQSCLGSGSLDPEDPNMASMAVVSGQTVSHLTEIKVHRYRHLASQRWRPQWEIALKGARAGVRGMQKLCRLKGSLLEITGGGEEPSGVLLIGSKSLPSCVLSILTNFPPLPA